MGFKDLQARAVGRELAAVIPSDGVPWYKKPNLLKLNFCLFSIFLLASANGYDGSMMNGLQALPQWQEFMNHPTGAWLGFVNAVQSVGAFSLYFVVAWASDRYGRKRTIAVGYFWLILGAALQTAAKNPAMFVVGRLCIGGATAFYSGAAPVLVTETAYPTHRAIITALYMAGWYVGSLVSAWATFATRNYVGNWAWGIPSILQIAIPIVALPGYIMAPESPRWYASKDKIEQARDFLVKYHAEGDTNSLLAEFEMQEITQTLQLEVEHAKSTSYAQMFKTKGNLRRSFITISLGMFAQWNGVGIASYYLAPVLITVGITSVTDQTMISGFLQVWNLILAVAAGFSVDRLGRRKLFLASCLGMLGSYVLISALSGSFANTGRSATGIAVIPFLFIYYGFYDIAFTPLIVSYPCEIWPYKFRARGIAMVSMSTQIAVFFNIFVNPIALESIQWKYYIVYVVLLVGITAIVWFFYPETNGHSLEEMAKVFDGDDAEIVDPTLITEIIGKTTDSGVETKHLEHM